MFRAVFPILRRCLQSAAAPLPYPDIMLDELLEQFTVLIVVESAGHVQKSTDFCLFVSFSVTVLIERDSAGYYKILHERDVNHFHLRQIHHLCQSVRNRWRQRRFNRI